ncbi:glycine/betaine ABC transporter substrate-binding protein [Litorivita pollutaquae]|uniref:Glycine/betaine ABC transporter substrate-binding protein n=1 Tax=Litorivita pollutaquae TaxID=2200892 RepID=A0A2V4MQ79_9RHOB|nr:choline ABC transporter substrate-binding protein [Litorivita pollutaquae]OUS20674.1 glycine/betaine ABC transporter substrate-binding protein [Rhodobacterales bacterium 59_46_T64]PYC48891.1 glycine/betaine ABC transporter substrate-binding protein [Litorivita pollutaquae]
MTLKSTLSALALIAASPALADCGSVTFSDVGWTDITTTTSATKHVLTALGYDVEVKILSVPVTFAALESDDVDVFLGNWMPAQAGAIGPYIESGEIESVGVNLTGTKYTLAVPAYTYDKGLKSYADIAKFRDSLDGKIYGIEPGNEGNGYLVSLTEENTHGLEGFEIIESSEQGMLAQVKRAVKKNEDVVFLGWEPHPMNANFELKYLPGGEDFFGGEGVVETVTRKGYAAECPNVGTFLSNLKFSLPMENAIMGQILDDGMDPDEATMAWLKANGDVLDTWLAGVTTKDGDEGLPAVKAALGL